MDSPIDFSHNPADRERIREMARRHFQKNPRLVKSFVRDLAFLMSTIKPRYEYLAEKRNLNAAEKQEKTNLEEIIHNPALLAKLIVIREVYPSVFARIREDPTIISKLEDDPNFSIGELSPADRAAVGFITSWPQFKEPLRKANPANFISLSGSSGTEFKEEVDVGQFVNYATTGDSENFYLSISKSPKYKITEYLSTVMSAYNAQGDQAVKDNIARSIMGALCLVENVSERNPLMDTASGWADANNGNIFNTQNSQQIQRWVKAVQSSSAEEGQMNKMLTIAPYNNQDEALRDRFYEAFADPSTKGQVINDIIFGRFVDFLSGLLVNPAYANKQYLLDLIDRLVERLNTLPQRESVANNLRDFVIAQTAGELKTKAISISKRLISNDENKKLITKHLIQWSLSADENQKAYSTQMINDPLLWPKDRTLSKELKKDFLAFYEKLNEQEKAQYSQIIDILTSQRRKHGK